MAGYGKGGFGGGNQMQGLMKQAQKMQEQLQKAQEELDDEEIIGEASGKAVIVYMNGKKIIDGIEIEPSIVDVDDIEMLEDLILAAINDGYKKVDKLVEEKMAPFGGAAGIGGIGGLL